MLDKRDCHFLVGHGYDMWISIIVFHIVCEFEFVDAMRMIQFSDIV